MGKAMKVRQIWKPSKAQSPNLNDGQSRSIRRLNTRVTHKKNDGSSAIKVERKAEDGTRVLLSGESFHFNIMQKRCRLTFAFLHLFLVPFAPRFQFGIEVAVFSIESVRVEVDTSIDNVGVSVLDNLLDEGHDLRDVLRDPSNSIGFSNPEPLHIFEEFILPIRRERPRNRWIRHRIFILREGRGKKGKFSTVSLRRKR